ncbi:hypothetical protein BGZ50_000588, partial [Haplosporangium sp. Z 11]
DESGIPIIGNQELNKHLETMAFALSPYLARANKSVMKFIEEEFKRADGEEEIQGGDM